MESADTRVLTVVGFAGREGSGRRHMGSMLYRTHGFMTISFEGDTPAEFKEKLFDYVKMYRHHRFAVVDVETHKQAALVHELGGCIIWLRGRSGIEDPDADDIDVDYMVSNSTSRGRLAEDQVRQITMSWLVANANQE
jgi:hypothetical protein